MNSLFHFSIFLLFLISIFCPILGFAKVMNIFQNTNVNQNLLKDRFKLLILIYSFGHLLLVTSELQFFINHVTVGNMRFDF